MTSYTSNTAYFLSEGETVYVNSNSSMTKYKYINFLLLGPGGNGSMYSSSIKNVAGGGGGGSVWQSYEVGSVYSVTCIHTGDGSVDEDGNKYPAEYLVVLSDGSSRTLSAGAGQNATLDSSGTFYNPGAGGVCQYDTGAPSGSASVKNGAAGGAAGYPGTVRGYTSSGSGISLVNNYNTLVDPPANKTSYFGNNSIIITSNGASNTNPATGYGAGGAGVPAGFINASSYVPGTPGYSCFYLQ